MRYYKLLIGLQIILLAIGLKSRYDFLVEECSCHPNENWLFYFTTFAIIVLTLFVLYLAFKNKKLVWLYSISLITIYYAISEEFSNQSDSLHHDTFEPIKKISLEDDKETVNGVIYFYSNYYRLFIHDGEECGCNYKGDYSIIGDTIRFENKITQQTNNFITSTDFLIQGHSIVNLINPENRFSLEEITPP